MANANIPLMSQKAGTPITSAGTGSGKLQDTRNLFTPNSGGGIDAALIGALAGSMAGSTPTGQAVSGALGNVASGIGNAISGALGGGGGGGSGATAASQGFGGATGDVSKVTLPPGTTQSQIDAKYGVTNGKSNYVIAGVNPSDGSIIANQNLTIGGTNLSGLGGVTPTATAPADQNAGTYFQDSYGNIYDGSGNLYAVNQGGTYYVNTGADTWTNANTYETLNSDSLFGYTGGGYDPSTSDSGFYDTADYFANPDNSIQDFYDTTDYFSSPDTSLYAKGGMATPLMANGGKVKGYAEAGPVNSSGLVDTSSSVLDSIKNLLSGSNVQGALLGTLLSQIMGNSSSGANVYKGVDMSQVGNIAPKTTSFGMGPAKYVPYSDYMPAINSPLSNANKDADLYANLGVSGYTPNITPLGRKPLGMADGGRMPTHYTFGTQVNPEDFLAEGGMPQNTNVPMRGGLSDNANVPMLQGRHDYRKGAAVNGAGDGQSDDIPAMLADGEYVIDADVVAALGNGSNKAGAEALDKFRENIRTHKRSAPTGKIPPKAKSPLAYLKGAK